MSNHYDRSEDIQVDIIRFIFSSCFIVNKTVLVISCHALSSKLWGFVLSCTDDRQESQILLFVVKDFQTIHVTQRRIDGLLVGVYRGQTLFRTLHHTVYP